MRGGRIVDSQDPQRPKRSTAKISRDQKGRAKQRFNEGIDKERAAHEQYKKDAEQEKLAQNLKMKAIAAENARLRGDAPKKPPMRQEAHHHSIDLTRQELQLPPPKRFPCVTPVSDQEMSTTPTNPNAETPPRRFHKSKPTSAMQQITVTTLDCLSEPDLDHEMVDPTADAVNPQQEGDQGITQLTTNPPHPPMKTRPSHSPSLAMGMRTSCLKLTKMAWEVVFDIPGKV